jgi:hypothetical protein
MSDSFYSQDNYAGPTPFGYWSGGTPYGKNSEWIEDTSVPGYQKWRDAQDARILEKFQAMQPAIAPVAPTVFRNPAAVLNTGATQRPVFNPAQPYYQTTNDVQNQYSWAPRSDAQPLQQGIPNWGIQQQNAGFDVDKFIAEMLGPQNQSQTATLPTPYPGR